MARLLHLNGPPGVGKSSVARAYAADHPGALLLDADVVVSMISGWRDAFWETLHVARRLAAAMAREHLVAGADVVLPQLVTRDDEIAPYLAAVDDAGATYVEVVLLAENGSTERARFRLSRCLPAKLKAPALNARDGTIAIEEFQLAYERLQLAQALGSAA